METSIWMNEKPQICQQSDLVGGAKHDDDLIDSVDCHRVISSSNSHFGNCEPLSSVPFFSDMDHQDLNYDLEQFYQSVDTVGFGLDEFFVVAPATTASNNNNNNNNVSNQADNQDKKPLLNISANQNQRQQSLQQTQAAVNQLAQSVKTEVDFGSYQCANPIRPDHLSFEDAGYCRSDITSDCSGSPMIDPESPVSVASSAEGMCEVGFEIYHDLIMRHLVQDIQATCVRLSIPQDPKLWTTSDSRSWLMDMAAQYHLEHVPYEKLCLDGVMLSGMNLAQFVQCFPNGGEKLHAQLQIWNSANEYCQRTANGNSSSSVVGQCQQTGNGVIILTPGSQHQTPMSVLQLNRLENFVGGNDPFVGDSGAQFQCGQSYSLSALLPSPGSCSDSGLSADMDDSPTSPMGSPDSAGSGSTSNIHLWQFLRELLDQRDKFSHCVRWIDHNAGIFKIEDSHKLAKLWGQRKNRPAMNYDKLSRSLRQYYKKNILRKTTRSQRLVYQFLHPYHMC